MTYSTCPSYALNTVQHVSLSDVYMFWADSVLMLDTVMKTLLQTGPLVVRWLDVAVVVLKKQICY